jgi:hypothetical protein
MIIILKIFKNWCILPNLHYAIDDTHHLIIKPIAYIEDYYYHKIDGYNSVPQAIVDCNKRYMTICVSSLGRGENRFRCPYFGVSVVFFQKVCWKLSII